MSYGSYTEKYMDACTLIAYKKKKKNETTKKPPLHNTLPDFQGKESKVNTCLQVMSESDIKHGSPITEIHGRLRASNITMSRHRHRQVGHREKIKNSQGTASS